MKKILIKKELAIAIILLFVLVTLAPTISSTTKYPKRPFDSITQEIFNVSHPTLWPHGAEQFYVHVEDAEGFVQNAFVSIYKVNDIENSGFTDSFGDITFELPYFGIGPMTVNITKENYQPYQGICIMSFCGDADGSGQTNVGDAVYLIDYIFRGGPAPHTYCMADANADGTVNVGDVIFIIKYVFSGGPPPVGCCE